MKTQDIIDNFKGILYAEHIRSMLIASFDITKDCNLNCKHCYNKGAIENDYVDSNEKVFDVINKINTLQIREVTLCGGEPLVSPYFNDVLTELKKKNILVRIITNGLLIESFIPIINRLMNSEDVIQLSLDESLQNGSRQRYQSDLERRKVYNNLAMLSTVSCRVIVNITPTILNQNDIITIVNDAISCGATEISATPYIPIGGKEADLIKPDYDLLSQVDKEVKNICRKAGIKYDGGIDGHICQRYNSEFRLKSNKEPLKITRYCDAGNYNIHISNDGTIYPCVFMQKKEYAISHISKPTSEIKNDFYHYNKLLNLPLPTKCHACSVLEECNGGCVGLILDRYCALEYTDPRCNY